MMSDLRLDTKFYALKITLCELVGQYIECFELIMAQDEIDVFAWLHEKLALLARRDDR